MSRELLLLRHGKSDWNSGVTDFRRPLKDRGKRGAQRMGTWLWQQDLRPDLILSSPAERALTTAHKCCKSMGQGEAYERRRNFEKHLALMAVTSKERARQEIEAAGATMRWCVGIGH